MNLQRAVDLDKRTRRRRLANTTEQIIMKNDTTYALLMRSDEKGRDFLETALYAVCILSAIFAILQFAQEPVTLMSDGSISRAAPQLSLHQAQPVAATKS